MSEISNFRDALLLMARCGHVLVSKVFSICVIGKRGLSGIVDAERCEKKWGIVTLE